jgi:hypothetical protein
MFSIVALALPDWTHSIIAVYRRKIDDLFGTELASRNG